jgi:peroxiredoxin
MDPLRSGAQAPEIAGVELDRGARAVVFYKVTCPACQVSAPAMERLYRLAPDRFVAVVQDPPERAEMFGREFGVTFPSVSDEPPYALSNAYGVRVVPTAFLLDDGRIRDLVESWDRDGWNRIGGKMAVMVDRPAEALSWEGDGLPPFRPG